MLTLFASIVCELSYEISSDDVYLFIGKNIWIGFYKTLSKYCTLLSRTVSKFSKLSK